MARSILCAFAGGHTNRHDWLGEPRLDPALTAFVSAACLFFGILLFAEVADPDRPDEGSQRGGGDWVRLAWALLNSHGTGTPRVLIRIIALAA
jgi:hypothetical protein